MVHNGIEYGLMAAYAEGSTSCYHANFGKQHAGQGRRDRADPRRRAQLRLRLRHAAIAEVWRRGSVVASWLLDLTATALVESPELSEFTGRVSDSGEGRWTVDAAVDEGVPANVSARRCSAASAHAGEAVYGDKLLSAMRKQFGGHAEKDK